MKKERKEIETAVLLQLKELGSSKPIKDKIKESLVNKGFNYGYTSNILNGETPLQFLSDIELIIFVDALYIAKSNSRINPIKLFNDLELSQARNFTFEKTKINNVITINNVDQIGDNDYMCSHELRKSVVEWLSAGLLKYNPNCQRPMRKLNIRGNLIEFANIDPNAVSEIVKSIEDGTFFSNILTFNIRKTGEENKIIYYKERRQLKINVNDSTFVDIADGMHRIAAFLQVVEKDPNHTGETMIRLLHEEESVVQSFIRQEATHTEIPEDAKERFNQANVEMQLVKEINLYGSKQTNPMFNSIGDSIIDVETANKLTTDTVLSVAIKESFKSGNGRQQRLLKEFLVNGFKEITGIFDEDFSNVLKSREKSYITENNMFIFYTCLLSNFFNNEDFKGIDGWENDIEKILLRVDFSKENSIWKEIGINHKKPQKSTIDKFMEYVKKIINENEGV